MNEDVAKLQSTIAARQVNRQSFIDSYSEVLMLSQQDGQSDVDIDSLVDLLVESYPREYQGDFAVAALSHLRSRSEV